MQTKSALRTVFKKKRAGMVGQLRAQAEEKIAESAHSLIKSLPNIHTIAGYMPMGSECSPFKLLERLAASYTLALPRADEKNNILSFHQWMPGDALEKHQGFGMLEPYAQAPLAQPDLLLVPLIAFDSLGHRLGYGAGFYDRILAAYDAKNSKVKTLGLAFACQQSEASLPSKEHDKILDTIITEDQLLHFHSHEA